MPELYKDVTEGWNLIGPTPSETNTEQSISDIEEELSKIEIPMEIIDGTIWKVNSKGEYGQVTDPITPSRL